MKSTEEIKKFRDMDIDHLDKELEAVTRKLTESTLRVKASKLGDYSQVDKLKKSVARIQTLINEKKV